MKGILFINPSINKDLLHGMDGHTVPFDLETVVIKSKNDPNIAKYEVPGVPFLLMENGMKMRGTSTILEYLGVQKKNDQYEPFQHDPLSDVQSAWYQKIQGSASVQAVSTKQGNEKDMKKQMEKLIQQRDAQIPKAAPRT